MYPVVDILTTCCASSKRIARRPSHIAFFDINIDSLRSIKVLNFVFQAWKRSAGVMIQTLFIDGTYSSVKRSRNQAITKKHFSLTEEKRELPETVFDVTI